MELAHELAGPLIAAIIVVIILLINDMITPEE